MVHTQSNLIAWRDQINLQNHHHYVGTWLFFALSILNDKVITSNLEKVSPLLDTPTQNIRRGILTRGIFQCVPLCLILPLQTNHHNLSEIVLYVLVLCMDVKNSCHVLLIQ